MDRPLTAESVTIVPSKASGPVHRRIISNRDSRRENEPSVLSLFLTNLSLLNLDILPDWPNIVVSSFSNHDARTRIKSTEYALYHLFRLYDSATTTDKLQPFFPPLEPLQSVNLRAALFRCLNDLKKRGLLSKDTVLRKSMLDDCQGDKLWEVCLNFSAIVLRKMSAEEGVKRSRPIAEKIGTTPGVSLSQRESMIPLAVAHKFALNKVLNEKRRKRETYARLYDILSEKEKEMKQRKSRSMEQAPKMKALQSKKLSAVEEAVEKSWVGSIELRSALIDGDTCAKGDGVLVEAFDQLWKQDAENELTVSNGAEVGLLQNLSSKATQQGIRSRMWQNYFDRLVAAKPTSSRTSQRDSVSMNSGIRLDRHRNLKIGDISAAKDDQSQRRKTRHVTASRYDEILTAMREELRKNSMYRNQSDTRRVQVHPLKRAQTQPVPSRNLSIEIDASPGAKDTHARSPSQTSVPFGPRLGRRVSSQAKSYEKPKVDGQREPIPLKSELFSPLKENRQRNASVTSSNSLSVSEVDVNNDTRRNGDTREVSESTLTTGIGQPMSTTGEIHRKPDSPASNPIPLDGRTEDMATTGVEFKIPMLPEKKQRNASAAARPSLAERTRMSIAFNGSEDGSGFLPDMHLADSAEASGDNDVGATPVQQFSSDRRASLLERTRESISTAAPQQQSPKSKKSSHNRSKSSHPVNQFETPKKTRSSTIGVHEGKRYATPIEQLLSPDAEYESVFKSRPRVVHSPVLSPNLDAEPNGNISLNSDIGTSGPLLDVGADLT